MIRCKLPPMSIKGTDFTKGNTSLNQQSLQFTLQHSCLLLHCVCCTWPGVHRMQLKEYETSTQHLHLNNRMECTHMDSCMHACTHAHMYTHHYGPTTTTVLHNTTMDQRQQLCYTTPLIALCFHTLPLNGPYQSGFSFCISFFSTHC